MAMVLMTLMGCQASNQTTQPNAINQETQSKQNQKIDVSHQIYFKFKNQYSQL